MEVSGQLHVPAPLPRKKKPVPIGQEAAWAPELDAMEKRKISRNFLEGLRKTTKTAVKIRTGNIVPKRYHMRVSLLGNNEWMSELVSK
jgi:hypothetical protein